MTLKHLLLTTALGSAAVAALPNAAGIASSAEAQLSARQVPEGNCFNGDCDFVPCSFCDDNGCWTREDPALIDPEEEYRFLGTGFAPSSECIRTVLSVSPTLTSVSSSSLSSTSTSSTSITSITTISRTISTTSTTTSSTSTSITPIATAAAYIEMLLSHHNIHRQNHTVPDVVWSPSLAATADKIASKCVWGHDTSVDGGGYGQNIGAGFQVSQMGRFVTEGMYNPEVTKYTYYGGEPDTNTVGSWGHFSQIVWKGTAAIGCATHDCSSNPNGLQNAPGIPPLFTVCNYSPAGNVVGSFKDNVLRPVGNPSIDGNYDCQFPSCA